MHHIIKLAKYFIILVLSPFTMFYYLDKYTTAERYTEEWEYAAADFIVILCVGGLLSPLYIFAILTAIGVV